MKSLTLRGWDGLLGMIRATTMALLAFMMLTVCYDAFMRYAFSSPTSWSMELNSFLLVYLAIVSAAEAQRHDSHIRITFFVDKLPPRVRALISLGAALLGMLFCSIMVWRGGLMAMQAFEHGERVSSSLGTPMVYPYAVIPLGFGVLALQFAIDAVESIRPLAGQVPNNQEASNHG